MHHPIGVRAVVHVDLLHLQVFVDPVEREARSGSRRVGVVGDRPQGVCPRHQGTDAAL